MVNPKEVVERSAVVEPPRPAVIPKALSAEKLVISKSRSGSLDEGGGQRPRITVTEEKVSPAAAAAALSQVPPVPDRIDRATLERAFKNVASPGPSPTSDDQTALKRKKVIEELFTTER